MTDIDDAFVTVRSSEARETIVRELYGTELRRPSEFMDAVMEETGTSKANFYQSLNSLEGSVVEKLEGNDRATLYSLTDLGEQVAERLDLTGDEDEELTTGQTAPSSGQNLGTPGGAERGYAYDPSAGTGDTRDDSGSSMRDGPQNQDQRDQPSREAVREQMRDALRTLSTDEVRSLLEEELARRADDDQ